MLSLVANRSPVHMRRKGREMDKSLSSGYAIPKPIKLSTSGLIKNIAIQE